MAKARAQGDGGHRTAASTFAALVREAADLMEAHESFAHEWHLLAAFDTVQRAEDAAPPESRSPAAVLTFDRTRRRVLAALTAFARRKLAAESDPGPDLVEWRAARIVHGVRAEYLQARLDLWAWLDEPTKASPPSGRPTPLVKRAAARLGVSDSAAWREWSEEHLSAGTPDAAASRRLVAEVQALHEEAKAVRKARAKPTKASVGMRPINFRGKAHKK